MNIYSVQCGSQLLRLPIGSKEAVCWGWNEHGVCGTGDEKNVHKPTVIPSLINKNVDMVACCGGTTFAVVSLNTLG